MECVETVRFLMNSEIPIENLEEIAAFVANPDQRKTRDQALEYIVLRPLLGMSPVQLEELQKQIHERYKILLPNSLIQEILDRLLEPQAQGRSLIKRVGNEEDPSVTLYGLSAIGIDHVESFTKTSGEPVKEAAAWILKQIEMHIQRTLTETQKEALSQHFHRLLAEAFFVRGLPCLELLSPNKERRLLLVQTLILPVVTSPVGDELEELKDLYGVFRTVWGDFLSGAYEKAHKLIDLLVESYVLTQILNFDPLGRRFLKRDLESKTVYLDTNFIIGTLCSSDNLHDDSVGLIRKMSLLGMKMRYTEATREELYRVIGIAKAVLDKIVFLEAPTRRRIVHDTRFSILENFFTEHSSSWDRYVDGIFSRLERLRRYGIEPELDESKTRQIAGEISGLQRDIMRICDKYEDEAKHDALHCRLIQELRRTNRDGELGAAWSNFWFLTWDGKLFAYDGLFLSGETEGRITCCMLGDGLEYLLRPFMSLYREKTEPLIEEVPEVEVFAGLVGSRFFETLNGLARETVRLIGQKAWAQVDKEKTDKSYQVILAEIRKMITTDAINRTLSSERYAEEVRTVRGKEEKRSDGATPAIGT
jgi:hypothetical protein